MDDKKIERRENAILIKFSDDEIRVIEDYCKGKYLRPVPALRSLVLIKLDELKEMEDSK